MPDAQVTSSADVRTVLRLESLRKVYGRGPGAVTALDDVSLDLPAGSFTAIMGPSGSGKSTFLHCAAGLDRPTSGAVWLGGTDLTRLRERQLTAVRRDRLGFVFQAYNLMSALTVDQNLTLPARLAGRAVDQAWLDRIVDAIGLSGLLDRRPGQLSGGQQQRAAIARALVLRPAVVFADEPTGALDSRTARHVLALLRRIVDDTGQTVVMVTHDPIAASFADRVVFLADGRLAGSMADPTPETVAARMTHLGAW